MISARLSSRQPTQSLPMDIETLASVCGNIRLSSDVNEDSVNDVIDRIIRINLFNPENPIDLEISTGGGSLQHGLRLLSWINRIGNPIVVRGEGVVCSMGAILLCANDRTRVASSTARIMIHSGSTLMAGNRRELNEGISSLKDADDAMLDLLVKRSGQRKSVIAKFFDGFDHWLTPKEAKKLNLIDQVI